MGKIVRRSRLTARLAAGALALLLAAHAAATAWVLAQHPFVRPVVARTSEDLRLALERAVAREVTPEWLVPRMQQALGEEDLFRLQLYLDLADENDVALPDHLDALARAKLAAHQGKLALARDCAACAWDILSCPSLGLIGACGLPVEISPLGDLNALRRAAAAWAAGDEIDRVDAGLAVVGLAATGAIVVSGGSSATAKVGAAAIRVGRRMGTVSARLTRALGEAVDGLILWDRVPAAIVSRNFDQALDAAKYARLSDMAGDIGVVYTRTSAAEAIHLMRYADDAGDLKRLARVAEAAGPETRKSFEVLGKARVIRLLDRVAGMAILAIGLIGSLAGIVLSLLGSFLARRLRSALRAA